MDSTGAEEQRDSKTVIINNFHAPVGNAASQMFDSSSQGVAPEGQAPVADPVAAVSSRRRAAFIIEGSFDDLTLIELTKLKAIVKSLQKRTEDVTLTVEDLSAGSIRLVLEGSEEGIEKLRELMEAGELAEILGRPVRSIEFGEAEPSSTSATNPDPIKTLLVSKIRSHSTAFLKLKRADLIGADLMGAGLSGADLSRADLSGANLSGANLSGADLSRADLSRADLSRADLSGADLSRAGLSGADLSGADLSGANLIGANLRGADLRGADLRGANLSGADLRGANLSGADLSGADLIGADLIGADLIGADLIGADLIGADLIGADLIGADLSRANLSRANLSRANFSLANLSLANLSKANVLGARFSQENGLADEDKADLKARGAIFEEAPGDRASTLSPAPVRR